MIRGEWELWDYEPHKRIFYDEAAALVEGERAAARCIIPVGQWDSAVKSLAREFVHKWSKFEMKDH